MPVFSISLLTVDAALVQEKCYALLTAPGVIMDGRVVFVLRDVMYAVVSYPPGATPAAAQHQREPVSWTRKVTHTGGGTERVFIGKIPMGLVWILPALLEALTGRPVLFFKPMPNGSKDERKRNAPSTACVVMVRHEDAAAFASLNLRVLMTTEGAAVVSPSDKARFLQQLEERDVHLEAFIRARFPDRLNSAGRARKAGQPLTIEVRRFDTTLLRRVFRWNPYSVGPEAKTFFTTPW